MRITVNEVTAWFESTKLPSFTDFTGRDLELLNHLEEEVLQRIQSAHDTTGWTNNTNTPKIVRTVIAKMFASWFYERQYSEDGETNTYSKRLQDNANTLIDGILDGTIPIDDTPATIGQPIFYPNDASSALEPTKDDSSLGPNKFSMGQVF